MICSSSLANDLTPLVLDTSVLINLHACSFGEQILKIIPNTITVPDMVIRELGHKTSRTNGEYGFLDGLLARESVKPVSLDDAGWMIFEKLTTSAPSLGDGEAATLSAGNSH